MGRDSGGKSDKKFWTKLVENCVYPVTILILRGAFNRKFYEKTKEATFKTSKFYVLQFIHSFRIVAVLSHYLDLLCAAAICPASSPISRFLALKTDFIARIVAALRSVKKTFPAAVPYGKTPYERSYVAKFSVRNSLFLKKVMDICPKNF